MARARRLWPLLSGLLLTSCYFAVDWDGFSGQAAPTDAGPDVVDAALTDASDANAGDADADAAESCPDGGFCDGFERTQPLGAWDDAKLIQGSLAITTHAYTGSGALRTLLEAEGGSQVLVEKTFPASTSMRFRFELFEHTAARTHGITPLAFNYSDRKEILIVGLEGNVARLYEQEIANDGTEVYFNKFDPTPRLTNQWVEVILEVTLGSTGHVKLTYGGTVVTDADLARMYGATEFTAAAGENYSMAGDPSSFDIDDVQVSWVPSH